VYREPANETTSVEKLMGMFVSQLDKKPKTLAERIGGAMRDKVKEAIKVQMSQMRTPQAFN
jgi:hypothetical protein